jgi:hypothetical protein
MSFTGKAPGVNPNLDMIVNPKQMSQGVAMTYVASGSGTFDIQVLNINAIQT